MASITVRNLDDEVKRKLRIRAAEHGCSMEAEAREILTQAVDPPIAPPEGLETRIHERFKDTGGVDLKLPERQTIEASQDTVEKIREAQSKAEVAEPRQYKSDLFRRIRAIVDEVGGIDLELPPRGPGREPPTFR